MGSRSRKKLTARQEAAQARVRGKSGKFRKAPAPGDLPRSTLGARAARAREVAGGELAFMLGGGTVDPDDHLFRSTREGIRDLPRYTHERQIELAFGLYVTDPLAKFVIDSTVDHVIGQGLTWKIDPTEAEAEAERAEKAAEVKKKAEGRAKVEAARKAAKAKAFAAAGVPEGGATAAQGQGPGPEADAEGEEKAKAREADNTITVADAQPAPLPETDPVATVQADLAEDADPREPDPDAAPIDLINDIEPTVAELEAVIKEHWNDPDNNWPIKGRDRATGLGLWGEQLWPAFVAPSTGRVKLGRIDPRRIDHIRTDPENDDRATHAVLHSVVDNAGNTIGTGAPGNGPRAYRLVNEDDGRGDSAAVPPDIATSGPAGPAAVSMAGPLPSSPSSPSSTDSAGYLLGEAFYFAVNKVQGAKRGHSDIFHLIDWIDALGNLMFDMLDAAKAQRAFLYDVLLKGASPAQVKSWLREHATPPRPGAVRAHNESETWTPISPELKGSDHAEFVRVFRAHILGGAGIPEHWYGQGDVVNRAGGEKSQQPAMVRLDARRTVFMFHVEFVLRFVIDQAILAGRFGKTADGKRRGTPTTKLRVHVVAPELAVEDVGTAAAALSQGVSALAVAEDRKWVTKDTARAGFASIATHVGVKVDPAQEKAAVEAQESADAESGAEGPGFGGSDIDSESAALRAALAQNVGGRGVVPVGGAGSVSGSGARQDTDDESHAQETMRSARDTLDGVRAAPEEEVTRDEFRAEMATFKAEFLGGLLAQAHAREASATADRAVERSRDAERAHAREVAAAVPPPPSAPMFALPGAQVNIPDGAKITLDATPEMLRHAAESAATQATGSIVQAIEKLTLAAQAGNAGVAKAIVDKAIPVAEPGVVNVLPAPLPPINVMPSTANVEVAAPSVTVNAVPGELKVVLEAPARAKRDVKLTVDGVDVTGTVG